MEYTDLTGPEAALGIPMVCHTGLTISQHYGDMISRGTLHHGATTSFNRDVPGNVSPFLYAYGPVWQ